jgi:hypothetical protein
MSFCLFCDNASMLKSFLVGVPYCTSDHDILADLALVKALLS